MADAPAIADLARELGYAPGLAQVERALRRFTADTERAAFVVLGPEGGVVGWTSVSLETTLTDAPFGLIQGLVVDASARGGGLGRALVEAARNWAFERGAASLRVRANVTRADAHAFYARLGFERIKEQVVFWQANPLAEPKF